MVKAGGIRPVLRILAPRRLTRESGSGKRASAEIRANVSAAAAAKTESAAASGVVVLTALSSIPIIGTACTSASTCIRRRTARGGIAFIDGEVNDEEDGDISSRPV